MQNYTLLKHHWKYSSMFHSFLYDWKESYMIQYKIKQINTDLIRGTQKNPNPIRKYSNYIQLLLLSPIHTLKVIFFIFLRNCYKNLNVNCIKNGLTWSLCSLFWTESAGKRHINVKVTLKWVIYKISAISTKEGLNELLSHVKLMLLTYRN